MSSNAGLGLEEPDEDQVVVKLSASIRTFVGNSSGQNAGVWEFVFVELEEFQAKLWEKVQPYLKREIIIDPDQATAQSPPPRWSEVTELEIQDMERFVIFHNKLAHRKYRLEQLSINIVSGWHDKEIWIYVHIYSNSLASKSVYDSCSLLKTASTDRSGAHTTAALRSLSVVLKEKHGHFFEALDIHWEIWANIIQGSEPHLHQQLIDGPPPGNIRRWFTAARTNPESRMENVREGLAIGRQINSRHHVRELTIRDSLSNLIAVRDGLNTSLTRLNGAIDDLTRQLDACDIESNVSEDLLSRIESSLRPQENGHSVEVVHQIIDQADIDHE